MNMIFSAMLKIQQDTAELVVNIWEFPGSWRPHWLQVFYALSAVGQLVTLLANINCPLLPGRERRIVFVF